jgi:hypothetical protein
VAQRTALRHRGRVLSITSSASLPGDVGSLGAGPQPPGKPGTGAPLAFAAAGPAGTGGFMDRCRRRPGRRHGRTTRRS